MLQFTPIRNLQSKTPYNEKDVLVIFGEVFSRGYVNGLIEEAEKRNMKVIYSTVGRRDSEAKLRPLTEQEIAEKNQLPMINIPLEAGFDMMPSSKGKSPCDQLQGIKLSEGFSATLDWDQVNESQELGEKDFQKRTAEYVKALMPHLKDARHVIFAHTMAGGVPRAKIIMPMMNRVFKGHGDRYCSSEEFWNTDLGKLSDKNFMSVTANTFEHLLEATTAVREEIKNRGGHVGYVAYGYHGTEILINGEYRWQSYSPYLQGFAKKHLEDIAVKYMNKGVDACVFNCPEILTNSSSIFLGVEVALYSLIPALQKEQPGSAKVQELYKKCQSFLKPEVKIDTIFKRLNDYFSSDLIRNRYSKYEQWPQHNGPEQMEAMSKMSSEILGMHQDIKQLMTAELSEIIFRGCGQVMFEESFHPRKPVYWIGHDIIAKLF